MIGDDCGLHNVELIELNSNLFRYPVSFLKTFELRRASVLPALDVQER